MKFWIGMFFLTLGVALLCSLGTWQVKRLAWKEGLIAKIEQHQNEEVALEDYLDDGEAAFRRGYMDGRWEGEGTFKTKPRLLDGQIGYWIVTPFNAGNGGRVFVNRGWVVDGQQERVLAHELPKERVRIYGVLREHGALADYRPVRDGGIWVLFMSGSEFGDHAELLPAPVRATLRNEHRNYAIFWFTMAGILSGYGVISLLRRRSA